MLDEGVIVIVSLCALIVYGLMVALVRGRLW